MAHPHPSAERGKRLTKKQAWILLAAAFGAIFLTNQYQGSDIVIQAIGTAALVAFLFALISLIKKKGLRWR